MSSEVTQANIEHWNALFASRAWGRYPPEELVRFVSRTYPDRAARKSTRVLEVGCGPGANIWYLAREGFSIAGIDGSKHAITTATARLLEENLLDSTRPPDLRVGNFVLLPWPDLSFDAVIDIEAIYANTIPMVQSIIAETFRVLKPGGHFFSKMFGPKTSGVNTGAMVDERTSQNPISGPLAGTGLTHVFTEGEIRILFQPFSELTLDWVHRSDRGNAYEVFEWLVQARK
jgi:SAM-dependent methyltransferase